MCDNVYTRYLYKWLKLFGHVKKKNFRMKKYPCNGLRPFWIWFLSTFLNLYANVFSFLLCATQIRLIQFFMTRILVFFFFSSSLGCSLSVTDIGLAYVTAVKLSIIIVSKLVPIHPIPLSYHLDLFSSSHSSMLETLKNIS